MSRPDRLPESVRRFVDDVVASTGLQGADRADVTDELVAHFEDGLASGRSAEDLIYSFGDPAAVARLITRARARAHPGSHPSAASRASGLRTLGRDLRYAVRRMRQSPGFVITVLLSLAVGIGGNTAIFTLVNAVLMRDPPFAETESLYDLYLTSGALAYGVLSYPDYRDVRDHTREIVSHVTGTWLNLVQVEGDDPEAHEVVPTEMVTGDYFPGLGIQAALGRTLLPSDDVAVGAHPVVVLGNAYWRRVFEADPNVVGQTLMLNGRQFTVVGVAPRSFPGSIRGLVPDLYAPLSMLPALSASTSDIYDTRGDHSMFVKVRLREGVTETELRNTLGRIATDLRDRGEWQATESFEVVATSDVIMFPPVDRFLIASAWMLMAVVGMVLLMACANLASFLLARAIDRRREVAVRLALGATRGALVRQLLTESTLLSLAAGVIGVGVSMGALKLLSTADLPLPLPIALDLAPNARVLVFSLLVSLVAGLLFGIAPALKASGASISSVLRDETAGGGRRGRVTLRGVLVSSQVAISLVLLVTAGLFLRSFIATQAVDPGFGYEPTALVTAALPSDRYDDETGLQVTQRMIDRVRSMPGVTEVAVTGRLHLNSISTWSQTINVDGISPPPDRDGHLVDWTPVSSAFFDVMGIAIERGRGFGPADREGAVPVVVINQAFARTFFPDRDPLGRTVRAENDLFQVVGIARDAKVRSLGEAPRPQLYRPLAQSFSASYEILANTTGDAERTAMEVARMVRAVDADMITWAPRSLERHIGTQLIARKLAAWIVAAFAGLALVLAVVGLYGIVSYAVSQRRREVGIRISLGAAHGSIVRLLLGGGFRTVGIGVAIGLVVSVALVRLLSGLLYGIDPFDPLTLVAGPVVLLTVSLLAAWVPARRATRTDPVEALQSE